MALEVAFQELQVRFLRLRESLEDLHTTVVEDQPDEGDSVLVDVFGDAALEMLGQAAEAMSALQQARGATGSCPDVERLRRALATGQVQHGRIMRRFTGDLMHYERIGELMHLGRNRGGQWRAWAGSVRQALERCQAPLYDVSDAQFRCWQEIAERVGMTSISVQNTGIGLTHVAPE